MMPILMDPDSPPVRRQSRGIYLLPNLLTTGCLFSGFYAIVAAIDGNFERAGVAVFIAMIFDGLDGRVARLTSTETAFGKEYDSLADMVSFGVAPAIVSYQWGVARIADDKPGDDPSDSAASFAGGVDVDGSCEREGERGHNPLRPGVEDIPRTEKDGFHTCLVRVEGETGKEDRVGDVHANTAGAADWSPRKSHDERQ